MSFLLTTPELRLLARLKLRGAVRNQLRRMKTPKGAVLTLLGVGLFGLWLTSVVLPVSTGSATRDPETLEIFVRLGLLLLTVLSVTGAFTHRGLYLPREEIERLFSAPVSRSDLIRYRLIVNLLRGSFGGLIVGLFALRTLPNPLFAFLGVFLAIQTLPLANQFVAILAGGVERRVAARLRLIRGILLGAMAVVLGITISMLINETRAEDLPWIGPILAGQTGDWMHHPALATVIQPFAPWSHMVLATDWGTFGLWFAVCFGIWVVLFEGTARLSVDFRELSLETSANVAARLRRVRRGGGASSGKATRQTVGWRIPWLFGRGPAGALAWRKSVAIVRKAKGTLWVSTFVLLFVTLLSSAMAMWERENGALIAAVMIATMGTLYLCAGLRFDFREELDRMEVIKAWPVNPNRLFAAMILPEVALVSSLLIGAILLRTALTGAFPVEVLAVVLLLPLVVFAWIALDNAVYLFSPVRFVPGQDGALQNAGRSLVLVFLRLFIGGAVGGVGFAAAFVGGKLAHEFLGASFEGAVTLGFAILWVTLLLLDLALVLLGGFVFRRFDVARDRG